MFSDSPIKVEKRNPLASMPAIRSGFKTAINFTNSFFSRLIPSGLANKGLMSLNKIPFFGKSG